MKKKERYYWSKIVLAVVLGLGVIATALSYVATSKLHDQLAAIESLKYESLDLSLWRGNLQVKGIEYRAAEAEKDTSVITCSQLGVSGVSWWDLYFHQKLKIDHLALTGVEIQLYETSLEKWKQAPQTQKENSILEVLVADFSLTEMKLSFIKKDKARLRLEDFNLQLGEIQHQFSSAKSSPTLQNFKYTLAKLIWEPANGNYAFYGAGVESSLSSKNFLVEHLELRPLRSKEAWKHKFPHRKERLHLQGNKIQANNIDFQRLLAKQELILSDFTVGESSLNVFIDETLAPCEQCYKAFIHEQLLAVPLAIGIDKIQLKNSLIEIEVYKAQENLAKVSFKKVYVSLYHISNIKERIAAHPKITADLQSDFQGKVALTAKVDFNLNDPLYGYAVRGNLAAVDLVALNEIFKVGIPAKVKTGNLQKLQFDFTGDNKLAKGSVDFQYDNLTISVMNDQKTKRKNFLSSLINRLTVKKNNVLGTKRYEKGKIYYSRKKRASIFHQWWHAIQSGLRSIVLADILLEKELK